MNLTGEQKEEEGYVTIDGQEHISDKIHNLRLMWKKECIVPVPVSVRNS